MRSSSGRRLASILFLDIVGSTQLASELGDRRFRELYTQYWRIVRGELRRAGGREQDPAGDGLAAVFSQPADALRAAAGILGRVQTVGVDVRAGLHTGQCEVVDGKLRGIAVHTAARVMATAGAAELLVTATVRELTVGDELEMVDAGSHVLKGVRGSWQLYRVTAIDKTPLPQPLTPARALERLHALQGDRRGRNGRNRLTILVAAALGAVATAVATPLLTLGGDGPTQAAGAASPISLLRVDPANNRVAAVVRDRDVALDTYVGLATVNGSLQQFVMKKRTEVERDVRTGRVLRRLKLDRLLRDFDFGLGSFWTLRAGFGSRPATVERIDPLSGRHLATLKLPASVSVSSDVGFIGFDGGKVWVLDEAMQLAELDPSTHHILGTWPSHAYAAAFMSRGRYLWLWGSPPSATLFRFDTRTHRTRRYEIPQQPWLVSSYGASLWILDARTHTLTPFDPRFGTLGESIGLTGHPVDVAVGLGAIWVAAGRVVEVLNPAYGQRRVIPMPKGFWAGSIAIDEGSRSVWVGNSVRRPAFFP
jgi:class 3 adenylate cyclase